MEAEQFNIKAEKEDVGTRLDIYLAGILTDMSRSGIQILIKDGCVLINKKEAKSNYKLRENDHITINYKESEEMEIEGQDIPLNILYEDEDLIVINKPKGMVVHPAPGHLDGTLVNALIYHCKGELSGINGVSRPGIVHRIDKDTSGILVIAKSNVAHVSLSKQLEEHTMNRVYVAIVLNGVKEDEVTIDRPIGRNKTDRKKMAIVKDGKHAITHVKVIERLGPCTLIEARLETGRTHQIRVHLASIGNPLLGDDVYGKGNSKFNLTGQTLHAKTLGFVHPTKGEYMEFTSEIPAYFDKIINNLRRN